MTDPAGTPSPSKTNRILRGLGMSLLGVVGIVTGIAVTGASGVGVAIGIAIVLVGVWVFFTGLSSMSPDEEPAPVPGAEAGVDAVPAEGGSQPEPGPIGLAVIGEILASHSVGLEGVLSGERKAVVLTTWRSVVEERAHDYADLVLGREDREEIQELEVEAMAQAYLLGWAASRGWIRELDARQGAFELGRAFRDRLRDRGVRLEELTLSVGMVLDDAFGAVVERGLEGGRG